MGKTGEKLPLNKELLKLTVTTVGLGEIFRNYYAAMKLEWFKTIEQYYGALIKKAEEEGQPKLVKYLKGERKRRLNRLYSATKQNETAVDKIIDTYKNLTSDIDEMIEKFVDSLSGEVFDIVEVDDENVTIRTLEELHNGKS